MGREMIRSKVNCSCMRSLELKVLTARAIHFGVYAVVSLFASGVGADSVCGEAVEGVTATLFPPGSGPVSRSVIRWCLPYEAALRT